MVSRVEQHVAERIPYFTRRRESARVIAIRKDAAAPPDVSVQRASHTDREALNTAADRAALGQEVHVIRLHGEVHEAKPFAPLSPGERSTKRAHRDLLAQRRQSRDHSHRDVDRLPRRDRIALEV
jgi:hypothetical protein